MTDSEIRLNVWLRDYGRQTSSKVYCDDLELLLNEVKRLRAFARKVASLTILSKLNISEEAIALADEAKLLILDK